MIAGAPGEGELAEVLREPLLRYGRGGAHGARGAQPGQPRGVYWMCTVYAMYRLRDAVLLVKCVNSLY